MLRGLFVAAPWGRISLETERGDVSPELCRHIRHIRLQGSTNKLHQNRVLSSHVRMWLESSETYYTMRLSIRSSLTLHHFLNIFAFHQSSVVHLSEWDSKLIYTWYNFLKMQGNMQLIGIGITKIDAGWVQRVFVPILTFFWRVFLFMEWMNERVPQLEHRHLISNKRALCNPQFREQAIKFCNAQRSFMVLDFHYLNEHYRPPNIKSRICWYCEVA